MSLPCTSCTRAFLVFSTCSPRLTRPFDCFLLLDRAARLSGEDPDDEDLEEFHETLKDESATMIARTKACSSTLFCACVCVRVCCLLTLLTALLPSAPPTPFAFQHAQRFVHGLVQRAGFWGIFLCAAVPNPLFDLAGITCGHFLIPFTTFFSATVLGKAVVKVHIQVFILITSLSKPVFDRIAASIAAVPLFGASCLFASMFVCVCVCGCVTETMCSSSNTNTRTHTHAQPPSLCPLLFFTGERVSSALVRMRASTEAKFMGDHVEEPSVRCTDLWWLCLKVASGQWRGKWPFCLSMLIIDTLID